MIEGLIHARTQELNRINPSWDEKVGTVLSAEVKPELLDQLSRQAPKEDFYLLRLISEHPKVTAKTLGRLSHHPYSAIRENIARHPNSDASTLSRLSRDRTQPLWYLVAFNPNAPARCAKSCKSACVAWAKNPPRSSSSVAQAFLPVPTQRHSTISIAWLNRPSVPFVPAAHDSRSRRFRGLTSALVFPSGSPRIHAGGALQRSGTMSATLSRALALGLRMPGAKAPIFSPLI